jgi:hypothetical protein
MDESIRKLFDPSALPARGELGEVAHPDLQRFNVERDDELYVDTAALVAAGWEYRTVTLDSSSDPAANDRYFEEGDPDFSAWKPEAPEGGWLLAGMWEAEDCGPLAFYVREVVIA